MVYRLLGWDMMDGVYHKIQIISCASAKITLSNRISVYVKNILRVCEVGGI